MYNLRSLLILFCVISFCIGLNIYAKTNAVAQEAPRANPVSPAAKQEPPPLPPQIQVPPPALVVRGKEFDLNRVLIESAYVNKEIKVEFLMFDRDPKEKLSSKAYGLPTSALYKFEPSETVKNSASGTFAWTPTEKDIGVRGFAFEVINSKGAVNRIAIFYDVKP